MTDDFPGAVWVPGVLSLRQVRELIDAGFIGHSAEVDCDHSSFDLTLSSECFELTCGSVKPFGERYLQKIRNMGLAKSVGPKDGVFELKRTHTYVIRLNERLVTLKERGIFGQATAKSSVGRVDVLARLIVDGMHTYEEFTPDGIGTGEMFLEITPITFNVRVKVNTSLSQLRLFMGNPRASQIRSPELYKTAIMNVDTEDHDNCISLNTQNADIAGKAACAFRRPVKPVDGDDLYIDLWGAGHTSPESCWDLQPRDGHGRIEIEPGNFYIMRSYEKIAVPKGVAVYCRAIDETIGEMRIHYAGFAHPFFGYNEKEERRGTPLVFEVRGHDVRVSLDHRERMARLVFYRMSEDADFELKKPDPKDPYQYQDLQLSKFFKGWGQ